MGTIGSFEDMEEGKELKKSRKNSQVLVCAGWTNAHDDA
jgi:hypothetical protein